MEIKRILALHSSGCDFIRMPMLICVCRMLKLPTVCKQINHNNLRNEKPVMLCPCDRLSNLLNVALTML